VLAPGTPARLAPSLARWSDGLSLPFNACEILFNVACKCIRYLPQNQGLSNFPVLGETLLSIRVSIFHQ
jgi:hypothetical protein